MYKDGENLGASPRNPTRGSAPGPRTDSLPPTPASLPVGKSSVRPSDAVRRRSSSGLSVPRCEHSYGAEGRTEDFLSGLSVLPRHCVTFEAPLQDVTVSAHIRQKGHSGFGADSVKKESRERFLSLGDWAIQKLGFKNWDEGLQFASSVLDAFAEKVRAINTREKVDALLAEMPEPSRSDVEEDIETARELIYQFRDRILRFAKGLPHSPGGQPRAFRLSKHTEIRDKISELERKGVALGDAFQRVAAQLSVGRKKSVSARTIERIWQNRKRENELGI